MSIYLDTSFLLGLFIETDSFATSARAFFVEADEPFIISDFAAVEFASAIARLTRTGRILEEEAQQTFTRFDAWRARSTDSENTTPDDIRRAESIIRRLNLNLRAPDAIHLAIASRLHASLATFDTGMATNAHSLVVTISRI